MGRRSKRKSKSNQSLKVSPVERCTLTNEGAMNITNKSKSQPSKLILITDRLSLPSYRNDDELAEGDPELQLDIRPRAYFAQGLCYSCSKSCGDPEFPCEVCRTVAYCSTEHRRRDAGAHAPLCAVLVDIEHQRILSSAKGLNGSEYRRFRVELLLRAEESLGRVLQPREREVLLYARLCRSCHGSEDLERCSDCRMVYFCPGEHATGHEEHCPEFRVLARILETESASGFVAPWLPAFSLRELPEDFDRLVRGIFQDDYERIDCTSYAALSQTASPPLTVLHVIRNSPRCASYAKRKLLKIHVIGAELQFECANLALWEKLFLHLLPEVKGLRLELYGPELRVPSDLAAVLERPTLCASCYSSNRKLDVVFHCGKLYHQVDSDEPDLVCLFNPGLYRTTGYANQDTWPRTIEKFCDYGVPIVVTSYTEVELPQDLARMRDLRAVAIEEKPRRNPFASLRPERNLVSDDVAPLIYKNYFVGVARGTSGSRHR